MHLAKIELFVISFPENRLIPDDHILAQRLQAEQEEAAKKQEQREFEQLQVC